MVGSKTDAQIRTRGETRRGKEVYDYDNEVITIRINNAVTVIISQLVTVVTTVLTASYSLPLITSQSPPDRAPPPRLPLRLPPRLLALLQSETSDSPGVPGVPGVPLLCLSSVSNPPSFELTVKEISRALRLPALRRSSIPFHLVSLRVYPFSASTECPVLAFSSRKGPATYAGAAATAAATAATAATAAARATTIVILPHLASIFHSLLLLPVPGLCHRSSRPFRPPRLMAHHFKPVSSTKGITASAACLQYLTAQSEIPWSLPGKINSTGIASTRSCPPMVR